MNAAEITWTRVDNGFRLDYIGSNGAVITRRGISAKRYSGRNRQGGTKGSYYEVNGKGWFSTLEAAKIAAANLEA